MHLEKSNMANLEKVSCVITTKNEEKNLDACIKSILNQDYPKEAVEIIVVDNNSTDNTVSIARGYTDKVFNQGPERSAQRNFGIKSASGKYILYLDADMVLSKGVIKECVDKCENKECIALYIPERIIGNGFWIKVRDFERSFYNTTCIDAVRFVRKDKVLEIGGFDASLNGPEDWDFDRRIRQIGTVDVIKSCLFHNESDFNIKNYITKKMYYVKSFRAYIQKWGRHDKVIRKQFSFVYRYFTVFFDKKGYIRLLKHPILTLNMYTLRLLVGLAYLMPKHTK